ncbi:MAG: 4-(cytidine 5'-diphospho)-2-C-methyl-D-erythritol kinase [Nitrospinota bacterium]|nr:4-(cytidine 5'-diphospho)-2-C-methyl-D-erythritol kinase [Nitrospinota bacterium]
MSLIRISSPAKINLGLKILGLRKDGFHEVQTHLLQVDLFDNLVISKIRGKIDITVNNPLIRGKKNIVYKAASLLREKYGDTQLGARIHLEKIIPVGAGLGGGSGNAAVVLWVLNQLWGIKYPMKKLEELAKELGADVPFFLGAPSSVFTGRGDEKLFACKFSPRYYILIVKPPISLSTSDVYKWSRVKVIENGNQKNKNFKLNRRYGFRENDLEEVVFPRFPSLKRHRNNLLKFGAELALLSGSGSAIFGLFTKKSDTVRAVNFFSRKKELWVSVARPLHKSILKEKRF